MISLVASFSSPSSLLGDQRGAHTAVNRVYKTREEGGWEVVETEREERDEAGASVGERVAA